MKIRGIYAIDQKDRIIGEDALKEKAQKAIVEDITNSFSLKFGNQIVKEEATNKYPHGRFYLDIFVDTV